MHESRTFHLSAFGFWATPEPHVKPGITGWATSAASESTGFRGQTDTPEKMALRIQHYLRYIQNGSLWLDIKIFLMTPKTLTFVLVHRNAY